MAYYMIYDSRKDNLKPIGIVKCDDIMCDFYDKTTNKAIYLGNRGRGITYSSFDYFTSSLKAVSRASNKIRNFLKKEGIINEF